MKLRMKFPWLCAVMLALVMIATAPITQAKPFGNKGNGPAILIGEIACYGDHELKTDKISTFSDKVREALESEQGFSLTSPTIKLDEKVMRHIHMDAIAYGPWFQKEYAGAEMVRYAEAVFGQDYFWNDRKLAERKERRGHIYRAGAEVTELVKKIGAENNVKYLFFCNVREANIELKHSIFNAKTTLDERPKNLKVETEYYLIDTQTGNIYEGHTETSKTGQIINLIGQYGKAMTSENLLQVMCEVQAKEIMKDAVRKGRKILEQPT